MTLISLPFDKSAPSKTGHVFKSAVFGGVALLSVCAFGVDAYAQSNDVSNRITRLEKEIQTLSRAVYKGSTPPANTLSGGNAASASTLGRLEQLEQEIRNLTGQIERQRFENQQSISQLEKRLADLELRVGDMESGTRPGSAAIAPNPTPLTTPSTPSNTLGQIRTPQAEGQPPTSSVFNTPIAAPNEDMGSLPNDEASRRYEQAFAVLRDGNYQTAEVEFKSFLDAYPNHALTSNAKYWLGETYYVRGNFADAAKIFAEAYKDAPKGPKAPDNLLKLGLSLEGMGKKDEACIALGQLNKEYPSATGPLFTRAEQELKRLNCS